MASSTWIRTLIGAMRSASAWLRMPGQVWLRFGLAILGVGLVTLLLVKLGFGHLANASMLYIIVVLVAALVLGRGPAIVAAVAAFLGSNFFLVEPRFTFTVADPDEWIALLLLLLTAVVTGHLAAGQRARAEEAAEHERQARVLYDIAVLMAEPNLAHALTTVVERLRSELAVSAVRIQVAGREGRTMVSAAAGEPEAVEALKEAPMASADVLTGGTPAQGAAAGRPGRWIRVAAPYASRRGPGRGLRLLRVPIPSAGADGEVSLVTRAAGEFSPAASRLLTAVAAQLGPAMERARLRAEATDAEVLRRTDEAKSALLDAVSHDLRTPLSSIIASAGSLLQQDVVWTDAERRGFAGLIEQEAKRLDRIVGNLLDLSRIEGGTLRPDQAWFDPAALVHDVLARLRPVTERHAVRVDMPDELPAVLLDYSEIDQVLSNLVENAARYTPTGSEIVIGARVEDGSLRVTVQDNGPGLAGVEPSGLFQPFYRPRRGARRSGIGLGLAVARGLVEAHGGRISAENVPGGGARFEFTIPASAPSA